MFPLPLSDYSTSTSLPGHTVWPFDKGPHSLPGHTVVLLTKDQS